MKKKLIPLSAALIIMIFALSAAYPKGIHDYLFLSVYNITEPCYRFDGQSIEAKSFLTIYGKKSLFSRNIFYGTVQLGDYPTYISSNQLTWFDEGSFVHIQSSGAGMYDFENNPGDLIPTYPRNQYDLYRQKSDELIIILVRKYTGADSWEDYTYSTTTDPKAVKDFLDKITN